MKPKDIISCTECGLSVHVNRKEIPCGATKDDEFERWCPNCRGEKYFRIMNDIKSPCVDDGHN